VILVDLFLASLRVLKTGGFPSDPRMMCALQWAYSGFQIVEPYDKLAASFAATRGLEGLKLPWDSFAIRVPSGLVDVESSKGVTHPVQLISVRTCRAPNGGVDPEFEITLWSSTVEVHRTFSDLGQGEEGGSHRETDLPLSDFDERAVVLARRLVLGCIAELDGGMVVHPKKGLSPTKSDGTPRMNVHRLVRPVVHDVRREVAAYCRGEGRSPTVRTMVRGHWKRQPHGPGNTERKWIHVEPFWRGPEDGPIAIRPHRFAERS
jgi:hypothetical protein